MTRISDGKINWRQVGERAKTYASSAPKRVRASIEAAFEQGYGLGASDATCASRKEGWQPIETAPKDGTPILLTAEPDDDGQASIIIGCWYKNGWYAWTREKHEWPTLWMPLPAAPEPQGHTSK